MYGHSLHTRIQCAHALTRSHALTEIRVLCVPPALGRSLPFSSGDSEAEFDTECQTCQRKINFSTTCWEQEVSLILILT